ncbi:Sulfite reductase, beta subunit {hemoprotein} [Geoglobus ahangari]|uniref:Sulfite reductase, beta subunit (hemoprotein) n=1 Tax=Geoglobus ahangari TaxID=113653 RepID=A0A0F7IE78_9EURY|nr:nitrite/sulfite reductase [Geoglobus ahangari]AKG90668.1 Sulfite reductase, beta subunit {hemoprotein} [Geoglobus ahangari]
MEISIDIGDISKFVGRYSLGRDNGNGSLHFLRIKVPAGQIDSERLRRVAELSREYGRGYAEITDRQSIQLHWIDPEKSLEIFGKLYEIGYFTDMCGQGFSGACFGDVRNIIACPLSGKINDFDVAEHAVRLTDFFTGNPDYLDLPRKFKIAFSGCGGDCVRLGINDLGMFGIEYNGERGFVPFVGGSIGASHPGPTLAKSLGVFVPESKTFEFVKAVVEIHRDHSSRESKAKARFKNLVSEWGLDRLREEIESRVGPLERIDVAAPSQCDHNGSGVQTNGLQYYTLPVLGGVLSADKLEFIAEMADKHADGEVRLTPEQNVTFVDVDDVERLKNDLSKKFDLKEGRLYYSSIACASNFCGRTSEPHAKELLERLVEVCERKGVKDLRIHISGCRNACGCHHVGEIGLVGRPVRTKNGVVQGYDLLAGGDFASLRMAKVVKEGLHGDELVREFERLLEEMRNGA